MIRTLMKSIREYKKPSLLAPILVSGEVVLECIIPFLIAKLVNEIKNGCTLEVIVRYGLVLVAMAALSLTFGALAGSACAKASCGFARNLRKDMFYKIQSYSFENIDKFSVSSLVTRLTTDITNVQFAYMMIVRTAIRCPLMLVCRRIWVSIWPPSLQCWAICTRCTSGSKAARACWWQLVPFWPSSRCCCRSWP